MSILIVTSNRCGSVALAKWLKAELAETDPAILNPVTYSIINSPSIDYNFDETTNSIVILLYKDYKKIIETKKFLPEEKFDFTICLKRKSSKEQSESYLWEVQSKKNKPYVLTDEWIKKHKKELLQLEVEFEKEYEEMSNVFGYHSTYESVFDTNTPEDLWNISAYIGLKPNFYWTIKPTFKLRRVNKLNLI